MPILERKRIVKPLKDTATIADLIERLKLLKVSQNTKIHYDIREILEKPQSHQYPDQLESLLENIHSFGGMSVDTSDEYLKYSKEFKEDFSFKSDVK
jgi:predicted RNA-binding protein with RPS1 domain